MKRTLNQPRRSLRVLGFRIGVIFIAIAIALVLAEAILRSRSTTIVENDASTLAGVILERSPAALKYKTNKGKRVRPNADVTIMNHMTSRRDIRIKTNSLGFREAEIAKEKPPHSLRILTLGDSITLGDYLQADEVFVHQAEIYLSRALGNESVDVINAGVGDIGLKEEIDILEEVGLSVDPDLILIGLYLNDSRPPWGFPDELGNPGWWRRHSVLVDTIHRKLKLAKWIEETGEDRFHWVVMADRLDWRNRRTALLELAEFARYDWGAAWNDRSWTVIDTECRRLRDITEPRGIPVVMAVFPVSYQVYAEYEENTPQRKALECANRYGFGFLDLLPILRKNRLRPDLFYDQCHPTVDGNKIIGEAIGQFLAERLKR